MFLIACSLCSFQCTMLRFHEATVYCLRNAPAVSMFRRFCETRLFPINDRKSGDGEIRTHDPLLARQVLSQLSYTPI